MARIISITTPSDKSQNILKSLKEVDGLLELHLFKNASVEPSGDIIKLAIPNSSLKEVMQLLDGFDLGRENGISLSSSEPDSVIPTKSSRGIKRDINESIWEEMEMTISNDSNTSINTLIIMFISGALAAIGLSVNELHIVIGGMLVAPGFMPITRISLGIISRHKTWYFGCYDLLKGYATLIIGAAVTTLLLGAIGTDPLGGTSSYYEPTKQLATYWTTITMTSLLASAAASIAGALLIATKKSVFTSGVMIGLALVPSAAIVGIGLVTSNFQIAEKAMIRFALDISLVFIFSLLVFTWSRFYFNRRDIRL